MWTLRFLGTELPVVAKMWRNQTLTGEKQQDGRTKFSRTLCLTIQRVYKDYENKHGVDTAIILFAECSHYVYYFSS